MPFAAQEPGIVLNLDQGLISHAFTHQAGALRSLSIPSQGLSHSNITTVGSTPPGILPITHHRVELSQQKSKSHGPFTIKAVHRWPTFTASPRFTYIVAHWKDVSYPSAGVETPELNIDPLHPTRGYMTELHLADASFDGILPKAWPSTITFSAYQSRSLIGLAACRQVVSR